MAASTRSHMSAAVAKATDNTPANHPSICGHCQAVNRLDRRYCVECGKSLWEKCPSCSADCNAGEMFCGGCGVQIREFLQEQVDRAEASLAKASAYEAEQNLTDAVRMLQAIQLPDHRQLASLSERVATELSRLKVRADQQAQEIRAGLTHIRELIASHDFGEAVRLLGKLPPAFRTDETDSFLALATSKQREAANLKSEIRAAVENKQILDLAPKIQRMLTLQPGADSIRRLAEQVRDRLLLAATKKLNAYDYKQASALVGRIPECAVDEKTKELAGRIAEFNWLVDDLSLSPNVDAPLLAIASRFAKRAPGDTKNADRCARLLRLARQQSKGDSKRFPGLQWASPPGRTHVGCAVDWLGGSERFKLMDDEVESTWDAEPGRYFVAAGLALQGMEAAAINTNLRKSERRGLLRQLAVGKRRAPSTRAWGIDVGDSSLKVVRLVGESAESELAVDRCDLIPHRIPLSRPEAETSRHKILVESLSSFLAKYPVDKSDRICVGFPGHKILSKSLRLPAASPKKLAEMIQFAAKQQIPIPLDELAWSYESLTESSDAGSAASGEAANTLLMAAKQMDVQELEFIFDELQIPLHVIQSDAVALFNFAVYENLSELASNQQVGPASIALLDVGSAATNIVIVSAGRPWLRSFRCGGEHFTDAAAKQLHLTKDQAEQVKIEPTRVRRLSELYGAFDPMFARLHDDIQRSLESYTKETGRTVSRAFGIGGGFRLHGLWKYLRNGP